MYRVKAVAAWRGVGLFLLLTARLNFVHWIFQVQLVSRPIRRRFINLLGSTKIDCILLLAHRSLMARSDGSLRWNCFHSLTQTRVNFGTRMDSLRCLKSANPCRSDIRWSIILNFGCVDLRYWSHVSLLLWHRVFFVVFLISIALPS